MSEDLVAIPQILLAPAVGDYDVIFSALMQTERGRWFLQEYARRNRSADTNLLLAAIARIESAVCAERSQQLQPDLRADLVEMAQAITQTRAEVAEIKAEAAGASGPLPQAPPPPGDVFAAAERIRDVTWAMRGHGFDPATCGQLEELAATILSASALRDPTDRRAHKLGEVLQYLEHRIAKLIDSCAEDPAAPSGERAKKSPEDSGPEDAGLEDAGLENVGLDDAQARAPAPATPAGLNGSSALAAHSSAGDGAQRAPERSPPMIEIPTTLAAFHDDFDEEAAAPPHPLRASAAAAPALPAGTASPVIAAEPGPPVLPSLAEAAIAVFSAQLAGLDIAPPAPQRFPPSPISQRFLDDPLAALKTMSAEELVALFS
jgi:hypothetical protein